MTKASKSCDICKESHYTNLCPKFSDVLETYKKSQPKALLAYGPTIIDSGATQHMFNRLDAFGTVSSRESSITCTNSQQIRSTHVGAQCPTCTQIAAQSIVSMSADEQG